MFVHDFYSEKYDDYADEHEPDEVKIIHSEKEIFCPDCGNGFFECSCPDLTPF